MEVPKRFSYRPLQTNLKKFRKNREMTQTEFWNPFGVTQSGGSRYENGRMMPKQLVALIRLRYPEIRW